MTTKRIQLLRIFLAVLLHSSMIRVIAQPMDVMYLKDERKLNVEVLLLNGKGITYVTSSKQAKLLSLKDLLMVFNNVGDYVVVSKDLKGEAPIDFTWNARLHTIDLLVTMNKTILPVRIVTVTDHEVVYEDANDPKGEMTMLKDMIAAVIYKDGTHQLYVSPSQGAEILTAVYTEFQSLKVKSYEKMTTSTQLDTNPTPAAEPVVVLPPVVPVRPLVNDTPALAEARPVTDTHVVTESIESTNKVAAADNANVPVSHVPIESSEPTGAAMVALPPVEKEISLAASEPIRNTRVRSPDSLYVMIGGLERAVSLVQYEEEARKKIALLRGYINKITDSQVTWIKANEAINDACKLFVSEEATVELPPAESAGKKVMTIRAYLNYLKQLKLGKFSQVEVSWKGFRRDLTPEMRVDSLYLGTLVFEQVMQGIVDGKVVFSSPSTKFIEIVFWGNRASAEAMAKVTLGVMLSDISLKK